MIFDASGVPDIPRETLRNLKSEIGDFVLVGMLAIDVVTRAIAELPPPRMTRDIDVAIAVESLPALAERTHRLARHRDSQLRFSLDGVQIDVVPHGEVAPQNRVILQDAELDVSGLAETANTSIDVKLDDDLVIRVASLASLVVLKLIAWTDRGGATDDKDAHDVILLLQASVSGRFREELWSDERALESNDFDPERAGPFRVGQQIARNFGPQVIDRLTSTLSGRSGQQLRDLAGPLASERLDGLLHGIESPLP